MRQFDKFMTFSPIIYLASLGLAFLAAAHSFTVLGLGEIIIGVMVLSGPLFILYALSKENRGFVIAAFHVFLAVLIHPEFTVKDPIYLDTSEQFELLREIHASGHSWWVQADMAYELARSLKNYALLSYEISSPFWYWAFPPSVILTFWGVIFFFREFKSEESH